MKLHPLATPITFAVALLASSAHVAFAQEATPDTWMQVRSVKTRAEVRTEVAAARAAGEVDVAGEYGIREQPSVSTLPRAAVLADLRVYRESGLAALERGEAPAYTSPQYVAAQARYAQLRSSQENASVSFARLRTAAPQ